MKQINWKLALIILGLIGIVVLGWWLFKTNLNPTTTEPGLGDGDWFFPGGEPRVIDGEPPAPGPNGTSTPPSPASGRLRQVSPRPVSGAAIWGQATSTLIFMERATGHVYRANPQTSPVRLSNTTIAKTYEMRLASSRPDTLNFLIKYLKDNRPKNFWGVLPVATSSPSGEDFLNDGDELPALAGQLFSDNLLDWSIAPDQKQVFILERLGNKARGSIFDFASQKSEEVFASDFMDWQINWLAASSVSFRTKPAAAAPGFLYHFDLKTKELSKVLGEIDGLITQEHSNQPLVVLSGNLNQELVFGVFNPQNQTFSRLPVKTLADKCAFNQTGTRLYCGVPTAWPTGDYPDDWYGGLINFSDNIWQIDLATRRGELIFSPTLANLDQNLDLTGLLLDAAEKTLYFINKNDSRLWAFRLEGGFD